MDITCPDFAPVDETSDYGSRETSIELAENRFAGFQPVMYIWDNKGKESCLLWGFSVLPGQTF